MQTTLDRWNALDPAAAAAALLPTNGSPRWAELVTAARPFASPEDLFRSADDVWRSLSPEDWNDAFRTHPRIGERHATAAAPRALRWSAAEQAGVDSAQADEMTTLNEAYEKRFGRVFLIRALGRGRAQILAQLRLRLTRTEAEELLEAAEQQRQITRLRLKRWLTEGA